MNFTFTPYIYILFFLFGINELIAQDQALEIRLNSTEKKELQTLKNYRLDWVAQDSLSIELEAFIKQIELRGYLNSRIDSAIQSDSLQIVYINPGIPVEHIQISYEQVPRSLLSAKELKPYATDLTEETIRLPFSQLQDFLQTLVDLFEAKGNSFVQFSLQNIQLDGNEATAILEIDQHITRYVDKIVIKGYENFPKNFIKHDLGLKIGTVYNKELIQRVSRSVNNLTFAQEAKAPEILFTNDSTIVYLYLEKRKSNQFDGIIGFASKDDGDGLELNGYLDLAINNIFNSGETMILYWKNNGNDRQRFFLEAELPYLFNLPVIPKANFEIYRQDSTFSNTKFQGSLMYNMVGKGQIAAQLNSENSNDLTSGITTGVTSFSSLFYGLSYHFKTLSSDPLFPVRFNLSISGLLGHRKNEEEKTSQSKFLLNTHYLYQINQKSFLFLQNTSGLLNSETYFENELFRFGGIYNLRGVNEESIFASAYTVFNLEYRFKPNLSSYFYTITDYSYAENKLTSINTNVFSLGLGYAFQTKAGVLNLSYALGKFDNEPFTFDNSKIHIKIVSNF